MQILSFTLIILPFLPLLTFVFPNAPWYLWLLALVYVYPATTVSVVVLGAEFGTLPHALCMLIYVGVISFRIYRLIGKIKITASELRRH